MSKSEQEDTNEPVLPSQSKEGKKQKGSLLEKMDLFGGKIELSYLD